MAKSVDQDQHTCRYATDEGDAEAGRWHRWRWWELVPAAVMLAGLVGGWVWFFSSQAGHVAQAETRLSALERTRDEQSALVLVMSNRLSRMEPMLDLLVKRLIKD